MIQGSCLCAAVRFEIDQSGILLFNFCHCSRCQKRSGSAHTAQLQVAADRFRWIQGTDNRSLYDYSPGVRGSFCSTCGCRLPAFTNQDTLVAVPAGLLDGDPEVRPEINIHCDSAAAWHDLNESMTSIAGQGSDEFWREYMASKRST